MSDLRLASSCGLRRRSRLTSLYMAIVGGCVLIAPSASLATITITSDLTIVENRPTNDNFGFNGLHLLTRINATHSSGSGAFSHDDATVTSNNTFFTNDPITLTLFSTVGSTGATWAELFPITAAQLGAVEGHYDYTVTDGVDTANHNGNNLNRAAVVPHPTMLAVSDNSTTPLFTFTDPNPTPAFAALDRRYNMVIFDSANNEVAVLPSGGGTTSPSIQVTAGLLAPGQQYWFRAQSLDIDGSVVENIGESLLSFTPVPESPYVAALGALLIGVMAIWQRRNRL